MRFHILLLGAASVMLWGVIWLSASRRNPAGWASPTGLFASGLLAFYVIPSIYWQYRPWNYYFPSYFRGLPLVIGSSLLLGLPFLGRTLSDELFCKKPRQSEKNKCLFREFKLGKFWWLLLIPIFIGVGWRIKLMGLGWQGRLAGKTPLVLGSKSLAMIVMNFSYYYPALYFILYAYGNRSQRRLSKIIWILDGFFQVFILSRTRILRYVLHSIIFLSLAGRKISKKQWTLVGVFAVFVFSVIGMSHAYTADHLGFGKMYISPFEVIKLLKESSVNYAVGDFWGHHISAEHNRVLRGLDDAMYRLYDARSASAVISGLPDEISYLNGKTFLHFFYAFIPRYFWPAKPALENIHSITNTAMYPEFGNPTGTIAELYLNFGFFSVLSGGIVFLFVCRWADDIVVNEKGIQAAWVGMYPIMMEQFLYANFNFTQRLSEIFRAVLVWVLVSWLLKLVEKPNRPLARKPEVKCCRSIQAHEKS